MITVQLKPHKEENVLRFHPWIFSGAIDHFSHTPEEGDVVKVTDNKGQFLAIGHYEIGSIMVRILTFKDEPIDENFWQKKIQEAYRLRQALGLTDSTKNNTYRLLHGEGDSLPGLIIDIYDTTAVIQAHSVGMHFARSIIAQQVVKNIPAVENVYYKSEGTLPHKAPIDVEDGYIIGKATDCMATEDGIHFFADWLKGQKTGFFIDQRENRKLLETYSKSRNVLNMFCYTGGFSLYALRGGALMVHSVDSSAKAIEITDRNISLNFPNDKRHKSFTTDAFKFLEDESINNLYDLIILDPPAFAKHKKVLKNALIGYRKINYQAFKIIRKGGILFTFSCSQAVSKEQFRLAVFTAAAKSGRNVRILHQLTQPADHPINIYHPEGEYLKGLVLYVE